MLSIMLDVIANAIRYKSVFGYRVVCVSSLSNADHAPDLEMHVKHKFIVPSLLDIICISRRIYD